LRRSAIVERACEIVAQAAKAALGTYDFGWVSLSAETIARKARGDSPLLETGELRDSIHWTVHGNEGSVGSDLDKALWQELGTRSIPPRPFLSGAARDQERAIQIMAGRAVAACLRGEGIYSSEMRDLLHMIHTVKRIGEKIIDAIPDAEDYKERN
jgi:hypothetical protein